MAATRMPGITIDADGRRYIDKRHRGTRIATRLGTTTQAQAERRLHVEMERIDIDLARRAYPRPRFADCAARYLAQCRDKRSLETIRVHVRLLLTYLAPDPRCHVGDLHCRPRLGRRQRHDDQPQLGNSQNDPESSRTLIPR
jgi:hypothetical protein